MTADELLALPEIDCRYELVRGELIALPFNGAEHGRIAVEIMASLFDAHARDLGVVLAPCGFILERDPDTVRAPDVAFLRRERRPADIHGYVPGPPDLAVEIVSFNEDYDVLDAKVRDWIRFGVSCLFVVDPETESAWVHTAANSRRLTVNDSLEAPDLVPGWSLPLRELFAE